MRRCSVAATRSDEKDPDLLINFFSNVRDVSDVRSSPQVAIGYGYYGYRYGLYRAWPMYGQDVTTVHYKVGTANIDIVDAERMQLIWEGVAEGRISGEDMKNSQVAIDAVVTELFLRFPGSASKGKPLGEAHELTAVGRCRSIRSASSATVTASAALIHADTSNASEYAWRPRAAARHPGRLQARSRPARRRRWWSALPRASRREWPPSRRHRTRPDRVP